MLGSIFESASTTAMTMTMEEALICMAAALVMGLVIAGVYMICGHYTANFVVTLALLPVLVQAVIMMVNGNLGTSVAVLGAFSLIRFRSAAGSSREISSIFFSMAVGLAAGMGQLGYAALLTVVVSAVMLVMHYLHFGERLGEQQLKIMIPENLDYSSVFDDIFSEFTRKCDLERVKTTNLGTMYELTYRIVMKKPEKEREMLDEIRCRNGNLTVICGRVQINQEAL